MARELTQTRDWASVDPEALSVYGLPGRNHPTTSLEVGGVLVEAPFEEVDETREYSVEVEFQPAGLGLEDGSFTEYLLGYEQAALPQEAIARKVRADLCRALDLDDVFVEVHRTGPAHKRTRMGQP